MKTWMHFAIGYAVVLLSCVQLSSRGYPLRWTLFVGLLSAGLFSLAAGLGLYMRKKRRAR